VDGAREFERLREVIAGVRQVRGEYGIPPGQVVPAFLVGAADLSPTIDRERAFITRHARADLKVADAPQGPAAHVVLRAGGKLILPLAGVIDIARERERRSAELAQLTKQLAALDARLANTGFVAKAPPAVVEAERRKAEEWRARREELDATVRSLGEI
jgi:valyl-tRNA synthetase